MNDLPSQVKLNISMNYFIDTQHSITTKLIIEKAEDINRNYIFDISKRFILQMTKIQELHIQFYFRYSTLVWFVFVILTELVKCRECSEQNSKYESERLYSDVKFDTLSKQTVHLQRLIIFALTRPLLDYSFK